MRELSPFRVEPAFDSPPHICMLNGGVAGWLLDAPGGLVQCIEPTKATVETANWLVTSAFDVLDRAFPKQNNLVLVLDLHMLVGRTAAARSIFLNSVRVLSKRFGNVYVVPPAAYPPIYMQAFHASVAFARLLGMRVSLATSSAQLIERYAWRPLAAGALPLAATL